MAVLIRGRYDRAYNPLPPRPRPRRRISRQLQLNWQPNRNHMRTIPGIISRPSRKRVPARVRQPVPFVWTRTLARRRLVVAARHGASPGSVKPNHVDSTKYLPTKLLEFGIRPERWREKEPTEQARGPWKPSDCTSRTNQHHDDVAPAESRAMIGCSLSLSLPLSPSHPPPHCHSPFPRSLQPLVRTPETRWRRGLGVIGRISVIVAPTIHPPPVLPRHRLSRARSLSLSLSLSPSPSPSLCLSLPLSFSFRSVLVHRAIPPTRL
jgi:hypothetical protein